MTSRQTALGEICEFVRGVSFDGDESLVSHRDGYVPILRAGNIADELNLSTDLIFVPRSRVSENQLMKPGDIAICMSSGSSAVLGKTAQLRLPFPGSVGAFCGIIRARQSVDSEYVAYWFRSDSFLAWRDTQGRGANIQNLRFSELANIALPLPPLAEQQRIAGLLRRADRLRRLRRYALEVSAGYLQAVFVEMFGDPVRNPMGWRVVKLATTFSEKPHIGTPEPARENGEQLIIRVGEIGKPGVDLDRCATITLMGAELRRYQALPGDLFLARAIGSAEHLGKASVLQRSNGKVVVYDSHVMRLRFKDTAVLPEFMLHWLRSQGGRALFMRKAGRTAVQFNVNTDQIADIDIPLPSLAAQKQFVTMVKQHERLNAQHREALRQAEHLFQALLRRAFV